MKIGASHFLVRSIASSLRDQGVLTLKLDGIGYSEEMASPLPRSITV